MMQRVGLAVIARSPIERLVVFKKERGWRALPLYAMCRRIFRAIITPLARTTRTIRACMCSHGAPAQSAISGVAKWVSKPPIRDRTRAARPDLMPLWTVLDTMPEGRDRIGIRSRIIRRAVS